MCSWGEHSSYFFSRISSLRQSRTLESNVITHLWTSHFLFDKKLRIFFLVMIWCGGIANLCVLLRPSMQKKCSVDEFKNKILKFWLLRHRDILTDVTITCEDKQFKETDAIILMIFNCFTVKPLITNTSEEFIKCRLDNFSMSFILYYVNFRISENK